MSTSRMARRRAETRARLTNAARELFAEQGFDVTRINEITDRADVGFGSFYNHFDSKDAIVEAVIEQAVEAHASAVDALTESLDDPAEVMAVAHRYFVRLAGRDPVWAWLLVRLDTSHDVLRHVLGARATRDLQRGIDEGRFAVDDVPTALFAMGGALLGVMRAVLDHVAGPTAEQAHAAGVLRMLGVDAANAAAITERALPEG
ncbi:TetR/AcrR family transcriptional regulator [Patulibacter defluvii]|uniref:TetR/AcrR family transcriptional regulator n=1 Tax=Patulibacter defluvii TaxID=3095358 RepID=UPI002A75F3F6|nr:helix-turn-helix domain-containing protein [Patulibacter sp. DM4]